MVGIVTMKYSNMKMNGRDNTCLKRLQGDVMEWSVVSYLSRSTSISRSWVWVGNVAMSKLTLPVLCGADSNKRCTNIIS